MLEDNQHRRAAPSAPPSGLSRTAKTVHRCTNSDPYTMLLPLPEPQPALDLDPDEFILKFRHSGHDFSTILSTSTSLNSRKPAYLQDGVNLPAKSYLGLFRHLRYAVFTVYRRIFTLVFVANFAVLVYLLKQHNTQIDSNILAIAASSNFLTAILIRQDFVVNAIYRTVWLVPWNVPLRVRRLLARCYCYGGIHSGAAVAGTMWWLAFCSLLSIRFAQDRAYTLPILATTWLILALLAVILILAFPALRSRHHNLFEFTHRFLGWAAILLFWAQLFLSTHRSHTTSSEPSSFATLLFHNATFYNLALTTTLLVSPWLRLRKWTFTPELLSHHAVRLHFNHPVPKFSCLRISCSPLREWHPFATFPTTSTSTVPQSSSSSSHSIIVSAAGDWTRALIQRVAQQQHHHNQYYQQSSRSSHTTSSPSPPTLTLYTTHLPTPGVLSLATLFPRVLLLTTGSGIGPCLGTLLSRPSSQFARLVWSTRSPLATYGSALYDEVLRADPDALIIDTDAEGRPDLVSVAWRLYREVGPEAVFVLSNRGVTGEVVRGLRGRGVLAFGPIWDS